MANEKQIDVNLRIEKAGVQQLALVRVTVDMAGADVAHFTLDATTSVAKVDFPDAISGDVDILIHNLGENVVSIFKDSGGSHLLSAVQPGGLALLAGVAAAAIYAQAATSTTKVEFYASEV